jgi:hypothetical protein
MFLKNITQKVARKTSEVKNCEWVFLISLKKFTLHLVLIVGMTFIAAAQSNTVNFLFPSDEQSDVPLIPMILVSTGWMIDSSSITFIYPNLDSNIFNNPELPTITIIPDDIYDSLDMQMRKVLTRKCRYTWVSNHLLQIEPLNPLAPGTKYRLVLSNLKTINPMSPG